MKKFLKLSAAFLLLGVLAVGCIKPEPSNGIEDMRAAKAELLRANAQLVLAKVQVEAANAELILSQAKVQEAEAVRIKAVAEVELAKAELIKAKAAHINAATDYLKEKWALEIAEMEADLLVKEAWAAAAIEEYNVYLQTLATDMITAKQAYEQALQDLEDMLLARQNTLDAAFLASLSLVNNNLKLALANIGTATTALNTARAEKLFYDTVDAARIETVVLKMQQEERRLQRQIVFNENMVAGYQALYDKNYERYEAFIKGLNDQILALQQEQIDNDLRIQEINVALRPAKENMDAMKSILDAEDQEFGIQAWEDNASDYTINVEKGEYYIGKFTANQMRSKLAQDIAEIADSRAQFEGQGIADSKNLLDASKKHADEMAEAYNKAWSDWKGVYASVQPGTGDKYTAWKTAYDAYNKTYGEVWTNNEAYKDRYNAAKAAIDKYIEILYSYFEEGVFDKFFGTGNLSDVLGGISFNADTIWDYIVGEESIMGPMEEFLTFLNGTSALMAEVEKVKAAMDGVAPALTFWEIIDQYAATTKLKRSTMAQIYTENAGKDITELTTNQYHVWFLLYALFADNQVTLGLRGTEDGLITINVADYKDPAAEILKDFFGTTTATAYEALLPWPKAEAVNDAIAAYVAAVGALSTGENKMLAPFNRLWSTNAGTLAAATQYKKVETLGTVKEFLAINPAGVKAPTFAPKKYAVPTTKTWVGYTTDAAEEDLLPWYVATDVNNFFFPIELAEATYPSLEGDETYTGMDCHVFVNYAALVGINYDCYSSSSNWAGDLLLWKGYERPRYIQSKGHFYAALIANRDYNDMVTAYNHCNNGDYKDLQTALEAQLEEVNAIFAARTAAYEAAKKVYDDLVLEKEDLMNLTEYQNSWIKMYGWFVRQAFDDKFTGMDGIEDLDEWLCEAEEDLAQAKVQLAKVQANLESYANGWGIQTRKGFIANKSAEYQAEINEALQDLNYWNALLLYYQAKQEALVAEIDNFVPAE